MSAKINHTIFFLSSTFIENLIVKSWKVYYIFSNIGIYYTCIHFIDTFY